MTGETQMTPQQHAERIAGMLRALSSARRAGHHTARMEHPGRARVLPYIGLVSGHRSAALSSPPGFRLRYLPLFPFP